MAAEKYSTSLVTNNIVDAGIPLAPPGYYRSKLFAVPYSTNALIAAAGPLLSLLERLCLSPSLPPIDNLRANIEHELFAFHSKLRASKYPDNLIQVAYYLMAATLDEMLGKNYLRIYQVNAEFKSFTPLTQDNSQPQERFFEILNYIKERPNQYLDLIELGYFFLTIGFEGYYHLKAEGRQALDNHIEDLYQIIQKYRYNQPCRLFNENPLPKTVKRNYKSTIYAALIAITVITAAFFTSHIILENKAKNVLFEHSQLALLDN